MANDIAQEKRQVHTLVDLLASDQVHAVRGLLEVMLDPVARKIATAPIDDEEITDDEVRAVAAAKEWLKHNKPIPNEEVLAEFGLTTADWEKMGQTPLPPEPNGNG